MSGKLDSASPLERTIYTRLDGGLFGRTSLDCIRAVLHASGLEESRDNYVRALDLSVARSQKLETALRLIRDDLSDGATYIEIIEKVDKALA